MKNMIAMLLATVFVVAGILHLGLDPVVKALLIIVWGFLMTFLMMAVKDHDDLMKEAETTNQLRSEEVVRTFAPIVEDPIAAMLIGLMLEREANENGVQVGGADYDPETGIYHLTVDGQVVESGVLPKEQR